jgi:uncharacterized SAM-binding protein YcdF (DUF218 family)
VAVLLLLLGLVVLLAVGVTQRRAVLRHLGHGLVAVDPLARADAIVVLAGGTPFRETAAAALYREGWAPRVLLTRAAPSAQHRGLMRLGLREHDYQTEARLVLEKSGVPRAAIVLAPEVTRITEVELALAYHRARASGWRRVILVTSLDHTRRVKAIWERQPGPRVEGLVRPVPRDWFDPDQWWEDRRMAETLLHEYLGLAALRLGLSHLLP